MTKNNLTSETNQLTVRTADQIWAPVLQLDDLDCDFEWRPSLNIPEGNISSEDIDRIFRAEITDEMTAQLTDDQSSALRSLTTHVTESEINPSESVIITSRIATVVLLGVPWQLALGTFADAALKREKDNSFHNLFLEAHLRVLDFGDNIRNGKSGTEPLFDADQYPQMAQYVRSRVPGDLVAQSSREFFLGERPIPIHIIDLVYTESPRVVCDSGFVTADIRPR